MASDDEILTLFNMLKANYHYALRDLDASQISDLQMIWCETLKDVDYGLLKAAALQHVSISKWFPTVAELRQAAADIISPDHRMTAMEAWGEVSRQIRTIGHCGRPEFTNPLIRQLVTDLGWLNLCRSEMPAADRARFMQGYEALVARAREDLVELPQVSEARRQFAALAEQKRIAAPKRGGNGQ